MPSSRDLLFVFGAIVLSLAGCGGADRPPLGYVSGRVTLDGDPVPGAVVVMKPEVGRQAVGRTDDKGYFNVEYNVGERGTKVGPTSVHVEWPFGEPGPFAIPKSFALGNSSLQLDVEKGKQTFDIEMESDTGSNEKVDKKPQFAD